MPTRRNPFSYGEGTSANPSPVPMPMTGTGVEGDAYGTTLDQTPGAMPSETPASLRRRVMPIAGTPQVQPDVLSAVQQMLAQRRSGM